MSPWEKMNFIYCEYFPNENGVLLKLETSKIYRIFTCNTAR